MHARHSRLQNGAEGASLRRRGEGVGDTGLDGPRAGVESVEAPGSGPGGTGGQAGGGVQGGALEPARSEGATVWHWVREGTVLVLYSQVSVAASSRPGAEHKLYLALLTFTAFLLIVSLGGSQGVCACVCMWVVAVTVSHWFPRKQITGV